MKSFKTLTASLLVSIGLAAPLAAQDVKPAAAPAAQPAPAAEAAFTEAQVLEAIGWMIGRQSGLAELGFSKEQIDAMLAGLQTAAAGKEPAFSLEKIQPEVQKFMMGRQEAYFNRLKAEGLAASTKFMNEVKAKAGITVLPSGVCYEILKPGTGDFPKATDIVKVHYVGSLYNGTKFDSSVDRGEPLDIPLNRVIPGWTEGMQKINKGGKIKLYIPAQLGYGEEGSQGIPPNSALVFEVELLEINPVAPAPAAPAPEAQPAAAAPAPAGK